MKTWSDYGEPPAVIPWPAGLPAASPVLVDRDGLIHNPDALCDPLLTGAAYVPYVDALGQAVPCTACQAVPR